ncbi:hypothetical protein NDU88_003965 [Pleurodeles waltl]|uniref:Uncharacterized protein n=1 Tax=Pleurodeles waltl TaxID=8319 RepID=A0AAV7UET5_PLEWA|nr:hypothetical protein NDU88_003965 [Pleurodeles waltl]
MPGSRAPLNYAVPSPLLCAPAHGASTIWAQAIDATAHRVPLLRDAISCSSRCPCSSRPRGAAPSARAAHGSSPQRLPARPPGTVSISPGDNGASGNDGAPSPLQCARAGECAKGAQVAYTTA